MKKVGNAHGIPDMDLAVAEHWAFHPVNAYLKSIGYTSIHRAILNTIELVQEALTRIKIALKAKKAEGLATRKSGTTLPFTQTSTATSEG